MIPQDPDDTRHLNRCQDCGSYTDESFCTECGSFNVTTLDDDKPEWNDDDYMFI